ncbi:MAG: hypothetical protein INH41_15880 [Myxococcaceae bacterium]|nr:hypothetical protein [Myxococcaceae bacterium]MCA3013860.1 hypothetical protein [Myxococcaceae bacterium]
MVSVVLSALLSQSPVCINVYGRRLCGYDCKSADAISGACAETPAGRCIANNGRVHCFDPPVWLPVALEGPPPKPQCVVMGDAVACGYNCVSDRGRVACARTPAGACEALPDRIVCADPPPEVYGVFGKDTPPMSCVSRGWVGVCGYHCVDAAGALGCTQTPFGVCDLSLMRPVCRDPDQHVICAYGEETPRPTCATLGDRVACGYNCTTFGGVACARTPAGRCDTQASAPVCFDPPLRGGGGRCLRVLGAR